MKPTVEGSKKMIQEFVQALELVDKPERKIPVDIQRRENRRHYKQRDRSRR